MDDDLTKQIQERMAELPPDVRNAITSADFGKKVQAIGARHQLHIDQIGRLQDEVLLVMLAFSAPGDFVPNIVEQLHIQEDMANIIADEVSNDILGPIRESIRTFMEERAAQQIRTSLEHEIVNSQPMTDQPQPVVDTPANPRPEPALAPIPILPIQTPVASTPPPPVLTPKPELRIADTVLTQTTTTPPVPPQTSTTSTPPPPTPMTPPSAAATSSSPRDYTTDPYHEPID